MSGSLRPITSRPGLIAGATGRDGKDGAAGLPGAPGVPGAPGLVQSVNGKSALNITLSAADVGALSPSGLPSALDGVAVSSTRPSTAYTGTPTTYTYLTTLSQGNYTFISGVGYQQSYNSDDGGRTLVAHEFLSGQHAGYGDYNGWFATIGVTAHPNVNSATSWTGRNSATVVGGAVGANTADANIYGMEYALGDNGKQSVAALGLVVNHNRQATNARSFTTPWIGVRLQNPLSTVSSDALYQGLGTWKVGLDFTGVTFNSAQNAVALKGGQRIYLNADATSPPSSWFSGDGTSTPGGAWIDYSGGLVRVVSGNNASLQVSASFVTTNVQFNAAGGYAVSGVNVIDASRLVKLPAFTVATLPTANSTNQDKIAVVTDAVSPTYRGTVTGGGSVRTPVYCDGTNWLAI